MRGSSLQKSRGAATGAYALLDDDSSGFAPSTTKLIVAAPSQPGAGVAAKDEAATAAAIGRSTQASDLRGSAVSRYGTS